MCFLKPDARAIGLAEWPFSAFYRVKHRAYASQECTLHPLARAKLAKREESFTALFQLEVTDLSESIPNGTQIFPLSNDSVLSSTGEFSLVSALRNQIN